MKLHQHLFGNGKPLRCNAWAKPRRCAYNIYICVYIYAYVHIYIYMSIHYSTYIYFASFVNGYILCRFVTSIWLLIVGSSTIYLLEILPSTPYFSAEMAPHKQSEQATVQVLLHGPLCEVFKTDPGGPVSDRPL